MVPLGCSFVLHYTVRREGARILPRLLDAKQQVGQSGSPFAIIKVRQYLALVALEAGQLRLAYEESLAALDLIKQMAGYALLKGYFEIVLVEVWYQWNRLEEAHELLRTVVHDAAAWQQLDLLGWGYADLMQVEMARGGWSAASRRCTRWNSWCGASDSGTTRAGCQRCEHSGGWRKDNSEEASDWAAGVVFPRGAMGWSLV